jgi:predicted NAD/FAD-binding protein
MVEKVYFDRKAWDCFTLTLHNTSDMKEYLQTAQNGQIFLACFTYSLVSQQISYTIWLIKAEQYPVLFFHQLIHKNSWLLKYNLQFL